MSQADESRSATGMIFSMSDRRYEELARRLCAAFISHHMGVTYQTAAKYLRDDDEMVGKYWYGLAERVAQEIAHMHAEQYAKISRAGKVKAVTRLSLVPKPPAD
jgi:hypothetical protein